MEQFRRTDSPLPAVLEPPRGAAHPAGAERGREVIIYGGVKVSNTTLRDRLSQVIEERLPDLPDFASFLESTDYESLLDYLIVEVKTQVREEADKLADMVTRG